MATKWKLLGRKVSVSNHGSGETENDYQTIRILWSRKLGLELKGVVFRDFSKASAFAEKVAKTGSINIDLWEKEYFPSKGWENAHYSD